MLVLDISEHNGLINFDKLKNNCDGVMIRLSLGADGVGGVYRMDSRADEYITECHRRGIKMGVYHYSYARTHDHARQEAQGVIALLDMYRRRGVLFDLPIAYDMEDNRDLPDGDHGGADFKTLGEFCQLFCSAIEAAGYYAMIYASRSWLEQMDKGVDLTRYDRWLAEWGVDRPSLPCGIWQYTSSGDGQSYGVASPRVDENSVYYDYPAIMREQGLNGYPRLVVPRPPEPQEPRPTPSISLEVGSWRYTFDLQGEILSKERSDDT